MNNDYNNQLPVKQPGDGKATGSLVCGIISLFFAGIILGIVAIVMGMQAKKEGFVGGKATAGIVLGVIGIAGTVLMLIFSSAILGALGFAAGA